MQAGKGPDGTVAAPVFSVRASVFPIAATVFSISRLVFFTDIRLAFVTVFQFLHAQPVRCLGLA